MEEEDGASPHSPPLSPNPFFAVFLDAEPFIRLVRLLRFSQPEGERRGSSGAPAALAAFQACSSGGSSSSIVSSSSSSESDLPVVRGRRGRRSSLGAASPRLEADADVAAAGRRRRRQRRGEPRRNTPVPSFRGSLAGDLEGQGGAGRTGRCEGADGVGGGGERRREGVVRRREREREFFVSSL